MPRITAIEPQRKQDRFNIYLDGKFTFGASTYSIFENKLEVGKNLSSQEIAKITQKELGTRLMDLAVKYLSFRQRSQKEVKDYLITKISKIEDIKFSQAKESPLIANILLKLKKYQYISDLEFAKWWLVSRTKSNPKGLRMIRLELKRKGISDEIIDHVMAGSLNEVDLARKVLAKKLKNWQKLPKLELKKKVYRLLASRGFTFDTIIEVFANLEKKG